MKRFVSLLLVVVLATLCLVACNNNEENSSLESFADNSSSEYVNADGYYVPRHQIKDLTGKTFTIIVRGSVAGTYQSDDFTTESEMYGELIEDAVKRRNDMVEEIYGITLEVEKSDTYYNDILLDCQSNLGTYDAVMPTLSQLSTLASQGYLYELTSLDNFDAEAPWYDQNCSKAFSISNQIYFTTGDITILNKVNTPSILFNKAMASKFFPDKNFYQLARDKQWTFDLMVECANSAATLVTSDGSYSDDNVYGMVSSYPDSLLFYGSAGEVICAKDAEDLPYLSLGNNPRSVTLAQSVLQTMADGANDWLLYAQECEQPIWETSFEVFYEGRSLFRPSAFSATTKLRKLSEIEFGVLPMPIMDDTQTEYYSYCGSGETAGIAIPICAEDPEFSAYMIEAYSAWAKNFITKAYYEVNLRYKDIRDNESEEMLDIIFGNIVYDIGECYNFGGLTSMFSELSKNRSSDIVSNIESRKTEAQTKIDELIDMYAD